MKTNYIFETCTVSKSPWISKNKEKHASYQSKIAHPNLKSEGRSFGLHRNALQCTSIPSTNHLLVTKYMNFLKYFWKRNKIITINVKEERKKFICLFKVIIIFVGNNSYLLLIRYEEREGRRSWDREKPCAFDAIHIQCKGYRLIPWVHSVACISVSCLSSLLSGWIWISRISPIYEVFLLLFSF